MAGRKRSEVVGTGAAAELARRLRELRDNQDLTLRELARKSGYSQASLSTAESGRRLPSWDLVQAFVRSCGEDPAVWRQLWELAELVAPTPAGRAARSTSPQAPEGAATAETRPSGQPTAASTPSVAALDREVDGGPDGPMPGDAAAPTGWRSPRGRIRGWVRHPRSLVVAGAVAAVLVVSAVAWAGTVGSSKDGAAAGAGSSAVVRPSPTAPVPQRRSGTLVLLPGQVADLDSMAPDWATQKAPGSAVDDVWFSITDFGLHGDDKADIAVLPDGSVGTYHECAREENYGVTLDAPSIRPGRLVCTITSDNRVALLRIVDAQYTDHGTPDQITFDVVVWVPAHKT